MHDYDLEAVAFFSAIDAAFTPTGSEMQGCVPIHHELVQYLAGWCSSVARGSPQQGGPSTNHFLGRALNGFISTLYEAVWRGRIWRDSDNVSHFGCLKIPVWFILHCMDILQTQAEYENKMWDAQPSMRDYLRSEKPESY
ncbi:MAG: hypothetical protein KGI03_03775 [Patescibacteria group bacterium]|nr:hypothetical protein [Patescibacteria group bacterium]